MLFASVEQWCRNKILFGNEIEKEMYSMHSNILTSIVCVFACVWVSVYIYSYIDINEIDVIMCLYGQSFFVDARVCLYNVQYVCKQNSKNFTHENPILLQTHE